MSTLLVIAPHADDETLGCGGTILRRTREGAAVHWLLVSRMTDVDGSARIDTRASEIRAVGEHYKFAGVHELGFPTRELDVIPLKDLVAAIGAVVAEIQATTVLLPHPGDAHSDHRVVFQAGAAATKWFRQPSVRRVLAYETLSETDLALDPSSQFLPNLFIDIGADLEGKIAAMRLYGPELESFPSPRSEPAIRALATLRGVASGFTAAEAFVTLREHD
jgi:LmbE family N-acetylglucosaminyl deacetylase